ncbi:MAG: gliding motility lipoprotein GldH [Cytophagales bacterium]
MKIKSCYFGLVIVVFLSACGENTVYQNNVDLSSGKWASQQNILFDFDVEDTTGAYNIAYTLRNGLDYPYYNLYLKYSLKDSSGGTISSGLQELILMNKKSGKPYGSGFGDKYDHQFISLRNFKFPYTGKYYFNIVQYMRIDSLPELYSVGLKVIKAEE